MNNEDKNASIYATQTERVLRDEAELERRRLQSPQNQRAIKINPAPFSHVQTERNKRDEEELERRRKENAQHQNKKK